MPKNALFLLKNRWGLRYQTPLPPPHSWQIPGLGVPSHSAFIDQVGRYTHLFIKVPRPGDSEVTFSVFESADSDFSVEFISDRIY